MRLQDREHFEIPMTMETDHTLRFSDLPEPEQVFGGSAGMHAVRMEIEQAIHDDLPVLIKGESGTGKEVIARYLHLNSRRAAGPFVRVNCGSIQATMLNKELFGEAPATASLPDGDSAANSIRLASGGTLFLDGIAYVDWKLNERFARVLRRAESSNARIVCASSRAVQIGGGREALSRDLEDSFGHVVTLPPLRERKQDIPLLCEYLLEKFARGFRRPIPRLSSRILDSFGRWNWPGNIRELENWIARIVIFGTEEAIDFESRGSGNSLARSHRTVRLGFNRARHPRRHA
jgi:DNA-binding NtrC family response regulator